LPDSGLIVGPAGAAGRAFRATVGVIRAFLAEYRESPPPAHAALLDGNKHDFDVRQLWDGKASGDITKLTPSGLARYAEVFALTLARAHARTGFRSSIAAYLGDDDEFDTEIDAGRLEVAHDQSPGSRGGA
jgi:hypothetical protein